MIDRVAPSLFLPPGDGRNLFFLDSVLRQVPLQEGGMPVFLIGGAEKAAELDAKRAIDQGTRLAAVVEDAPTGAVFNAPESLKSKVQG